MLNIDIDFSTSGSAQLSLRGRGAACSVMQRCLELQLDAPPRGRVARLIGASPLSPDAVSSYRGALAELETGRQLEMLEGYAVLHSVPWGAAHRDGTDAPPVEPEWDADIQHLAIGPAGVFCLTSSDEVSPSLLAAAGRAAHRVSERLTRALQRNIAVTPILVYADGAHPISTIVDESAATVAVASRSLVRWFERRGPVLTTAEIASITLVAEQPATWHASAVELTRAEPTPDFELLHREVDDAATRARNTLGAVVVVAAAVALVTTTEILTVVLPTLR